MIAPAAALRARAMRRADLRAVMSIERRSYSFPWSEGVFRDCLRIGYQCRLAIDADERVLGYGLLSNAVDEAHILNLCVDPDYRRQGVARYLLQHLLDLASRAGMRTMLLEVRPSNIAALDLYASLAFHQVGLRKNYYPAVGGREDAMVLARRI